MVPLRSPIRLFDIEFHASTSPSQNEGHHIKHAIFTNFYHLPAAESLII